MRRRGRACVCRRRRDGTGLDQRSRSTHHTANSGRRRPARPSAPGRLSGGGARAPGIHPRAQPLGRSARSVVVFSLSPSRPAELRGPALPASQPRDAEKQRRSMPALLVVGRGAASAQLITPWILRTCTPCMYVHTFGALRPCLGCRVVGGAGGACLYVFMRGRRRTHTAHVFRWLAVGAYIRIYETVCNAAAQCI